MIIDDVAGSARTEALHASFRMVFDYVKTHDLVNAPLGRVELDGADVYINIVEVEGKCKSDAVLEVHNDYIDIQFPICGRETFAWKPRRKLKEEKTAYQEKDDIAFYADRPVLYFTLSEGEFAVFFPEDGHAPCIGEGKIKKAIAKVKVK